MDSLFAGTAFGSTVPVVSSSLPPGFSYWPEFLTQEEELELLAGIAMLELKASQYHEYTALRRTAAFGLGLRFGGTTARPVREVVEREPAPQFLQTLAAKVARHVGLDPRDFPHALVTEYPPGAPIGWHRDAPPFAAIYGVSLMSACTFRLRPMPPSSGGFPAAGLADGDKNVAATGAMRKAGAATVKLHCEPRSLYAMRGPSRSTWQHSIPPVKATRYSITLRTLR